MYDLMQALLKQRSLNTKQVLAKQKKLVGELEKEKNKRNEAEKKAVQRHTCVGKINIWHVVFVACF